MWSIDEMCRIAAQLECNQETQKTKFVNLGIGIPTKVADYITSSVILQSENGLLGIGKHPNLVKAEIDPDLINAGKEAITIVPGGSFFDSAESFGMIRSGKIDVTILGGMEVSRNGDLANWTIPGEMVKGMGGAMDLVAGAKRVVVIMRHMTKNNTPKLLEKCTLPLTGIKVVDRLITDYGVFDFDKKGGVKLSHKPDDLSFEEISKIVPYLV